MSDGFWFYPGEAQIECYNFYFVNRKEQTMTETKENFPLPFKGTASSWWSKDGRVIPVEKLATPHLLNIFLSLKTITEKELAKDNPYSSQPQNVDKFGSIIFTPNQIRLWLLENCITYSALIREATKRGLWDYTELTAKEKKQTTKSIQQGTEVYKDVTIGELLVANQRLLKENYQLKSEVETNYKEYQIMSIDNSKLINENLQLKNKLKSIQFIAGETK